MSAKWFCKIDQQEFGPLLIAQLERLSAKGQLKADSFVRREDSDIWISAGDVPELKFNAKKSTLPRAKPNRTTAAPQPAVSSIPVAAVAPPVTPTHVTPIASGPGIQIATQSTAGSSASVGSVARSPDSAGISRAMLAGLIGLGCVVVILLVAVIFLVSANDEPDGEQADADQSNVSDEVDQTRAHAKKDSGSKSLLEIVPTKQTKTTNSTTAVGKWYKPSSRLGIKSKTTRLPVCNVGIKSVWVSDDPKGGMETRTSIAEATPSTVENRSGGDEVLDLSALGVSKKKRVDITGKILEPDSEAPAVTRTENKQSTVETAQDPSRFRYVFVEVSVSNTSGEEPLAYLGWNGDGETVQEKDAQLFDQDDNECHFVSLNESLRNDRVAERTLAPGQGMVDVLVFELPKNGFESLRLVLPKEAVGVADPKKIGYEIEKSDIVGGTPVASSTSPAAPTGTVEGSSTPPTKADLEREIQSLRDDLTKPEGTTTGKDPLTEQPPAEKPPEKKRDAKEEFQELKRQIEAEKEKE